MCYFNYFPPLQPPSLPPPSENKTALLTGIFRRLLSSMKRLIEDSKPDSKSIICQSVKCRAKLYPLVPYQLGGETARLCVTMFAAPWAGRDGQDSSGTEPLMTSALPHQASCMGSQARFCCRVCGLPRTILLPPQPGLIPLLSRDCSALAALASRLGPLTPSFPRSVVSLQASDVCSAEALYCIPSQQGCGHTPEEWIKGGFKCKQRGKPSPVFVAQGKNINEPSYSLPSTAV